MTICPFELQNIKAIDLKNLSVVIDQLSMSSGRQFIVLDTTNTYSLGSAVFHDIYSKTRKLTKKALKEGNSDDLLELRTFIGRLKTSEQGGIDYYNSKGCWYHFVTAFYRFFGKTPFFGTHMSRLDKLECRIQKRLDASGITEEWISKLVHVPSAGTMVDIKENSQNFQATIRKIPTEANTAEVLGTDPLIGDEIAVHAKNTHSFIDARVEILANDFLDDKREHGTDEEKALYNDMTTDMFFKRLLTKRPLVFFTEKDSYLLREKDEEGHNYRGSDHGNPYLETVPLEDYISYDEMQISAYLNTATQTHFINKGSRTNCGVAGEPGTFEASGIYYGMVGARFEKPGRMEEEFLIIRPERNFSSEKQKMWAKFFGLNLPSHEEAKADYEADPENSRFLKVRDFYLDKEVYKSMMERRISGYLKDADNQAGAQGKKAYLHVVGLGLGVWANFQRIPLDGIFGDIQKQIYRNLIEKEQFKNIGTLDFSWFPDSTDLATVQDPILVDGEEITVRSSKRNPADKLEEGQLLCAMYAWDGASFPGNEFWLEALSASGDPAAACCSMIAELQNPYINPNVLNLFVYK